MEKVREKEKSTSFWTIIWWYKTSFIQTVILYLAWDLTCGLDNFQYQGSADDFPGWGAQDIRLGSCPLADGTYKLSRTYQHCGFVVEEDGKYISNLVLRLNILIKTAILKQRYNFTPF